MWKEIKIAKWPFKTYVCDHSRRTKTSDNGERVTFKCNDCPATFAEASEAYEYFCFMERARAQQ